MTGSRPFYNGPRHPMRSPGGRPRALVVFESLFGDTQCVAEAVADVLASDFDVTLANVSIASDVHLPDFDLVVFGAPTHRSMLSTRDSRARARDLGARYGSVETGMREWLAMQPTTVEDGPLCVCFDTRTAGRLASPTAGSHEIVTLLHDLGHEIMTRQSFYVAGIAGPLCVGELNRARFWADHVAGRALATVF